MTAETQAALWHAALLHLAEERKRRDAERTTEEAKEPRRERYNVE
jgi:hypothetical protein